MKMIPYGLFFYCSVFSSNYFRKVLNVLKCSSEVWKVNISFISKIFCYLLGLLFTISDLIATYLVTFVISVLK